MSEDRREGSGRWLWFIRITAIATWPLIVMFGKYVVVNMISLDKNQAIITQQLNLIDKRVINVEETLKRKDEDELSRLRARVGSGRSAAGRER